MSVRQRSARLAAAAGLTLGVAAAGPIGLEAALDRADTIHVMAAPVEITGGVLDGLTPAGAWQLTADHAAFGGFSGLVVAGGRLIAVSDFGWWLEARLVESAGGLGLGDAQMARMRGPDGVLEGKSGGDAEGLALAPDGRLAVSFERDHRVMWLGDDGSLGGTVQARAFERLDSNGGLEGLTALSGGALIALAEDADAEVPVFRIAPAGTIDERRLPRLGIHDVTGADLGPDGQLYLVLRHYSPLTGPSIRVVRYAPGPDGWPQASSVRALAGFGPESGIDNMEGIAVTSAPGGGLRLWLISDDNFNPLQRTLLMRFDLAD